MKRDRAFTTSIHVIMLQLAAQYGAGAKTLFMSPGFFVQVFYWTWYVLGENYQKMCANWQFLIKSEDIVSLEHIPRFVSSPISSLVGAASSVRFCSSPRFKFIELPSFITVFIYY